jgi:hypothetical protein
MVWKVAFRVVIFLLISSLGLLANSQSTYNKHFGSIKNLFDNQAVRKEIGFYAFETYFNLELKVVESELFLSPGLIGQSSVNNSYSKIKSKDCFYTGHVNDDLKSNAYIDLCEFGRIVSFVLDCR